MWCGRHRNLFSKSFKIVTARNYAVIGIGIGFHKRLFKKIDHLEGSLKLIALVNDLGKSQETWNDV